MLGFNPTYCRFSRSKKWLPRKKLGSNVQFFLHDSFLFGTFHCKKKFGKPGEVKVGAARSAQDTQR